MVIGINAHCHASAAPSTFERWTEVTPFGLTVVDVGERESLVALPGRTPDGLHQPQKPPTPPKTALEAVICVVRHDGVTSGGLTAFPGLPGASPQLPKPDWSLYFQRSDIAFLLRENRILQRKKIRLVYQMQLSHRITFSVKGEKKLPPFCDRPVITSNVVRRKPDWVWYLSLCKNIHMWCQDRCIS